MSTMVADVSLPSISRATLVPCSKCGAFIHDRYRPEQDYFSDKGVQKIFAVPDAAASVHRGRLERVWKTNFIPDVRRFDRLVDNRYISTPGAARYLQFDLADNTMAGHIMDLQPGSYKRAHRHGPGAHVMIVGGSGLQGAGYSLIWREGEKRVRVDWKAGVVLSPPDNWWHMHLCTGKEPARHLALRWTSQGEYMGVTDWKRFSENFGEQIEYEDEDPEIRREFEEECRKNGVEVKMPR